MKRLLLTVPLLAALSFGWPAALPADPGGPNLAPTTSLTCTGGLQFDATPGTLTNRGRLAWDVNSTSVFITTFLEFTNGTETFVLFDSAPGLKNLITCSGDAGDGFTVIATGFLTPR